MDTPRAVSRARAAEMIGRKPARLRAWAARNPQRGPRPTKTGTAKQAFGTVARKALAELIAEKTVSVEEVDRDRYGRVVGRVTITGKLVNAEMVRAGLA